MDGKRRAAWTWRSVWTLPPNIVTILVATNSTDSSSLRDELLDLDKELTSLVLNNKRRPQYLSNIELKYKFSDWELASTKNTHMSANPRIHPIRKELFYRFG